MGLRFLLETINPEDFLAGQPIDIDVSSAFDPLIDTIRPFILKASLLVGGIFGLYLILILVRVYYERRKVKLLKGIKFDLDVMNEHHEVPSSRQRKAIASWHGDRQTRTLRLLASTRLSSIRK